MMSEVLASHNVARHSEAEPHKRESFGIMSNDPTASQPILWLGAAFNEATLLSHKAISPAANRWQQGLIGGLQNSQGSVLAIGHLIEQVWPKGPHAFVRADNTHLTDSVPGNLVSYWNLPILRSRSVAFSYKRELFKLHREGIRPRVVITYNPYPANVLFARHAQDSLGIPWVCVVADPPRNRNEDMKAFDQHRFAKGHIFLSWSSYLEWVDGPKIHLDGATRVADDLSIAGRIMDPTAPKRLLYAGTMLPYGGIHLLIDAFRLVAREDVELWICGHGDIDGLRRITQNDRRIKLLGLVSEAELDRLMREAYAFVNPRPSSFVDNRENFPSKLFHYLSYCKPIISTWTPGLSPGYRSVLTVLDSEDPPAISEKINCVLDWSQSAYEQQSQKVADFVRSQKTWSAQGCRLIEWLRTDIEVVNVS